jgi:hypothetical protein
MGKRKTIRNIEKKLLQHQKNLDIKIILLIEEVVVGMTMMMSIMKIIVNNILIMMKALIQAVFIVLKTNLGIETIRKVMMNIGSVKNEKMMHISTEKTEDLVGKLTQLMMT